jgi:hypothetical protein
MSDGTIECARHGRELAYIACVHIVREKKPVAYRKVATREEAGDLLCESYYQRVLEMTSEQNLITICACCAGEKQA